MCVYFCRYKHSEFKYLCNSTVRSEEVMPLMFSCIGCTEMHFPMVNICPTPTNVRKKSAELISIWTVVYSIALKSLYVDAHDLVCKRCGGKSNVVLFPV